MGVILVLSGILLFSSAIAGAAPQGTLKEAIHWGLSADWLDPATSTHVTSAFFILYFIHDALIKAMPNETYAPSLAESWGVRGRCSYVDYRFFLVG